MAKHIEAHKKGDFILVGKFIRDTENVDINAENPNYGFFQPSQHYFCKTKGRTWFDPRCSLAGIDPPEANRVENAKIYCKKCDPFEQRWDDEDTWKKKTYAMNAVIKHEEKCSGKRDRGGGKEEVAAEPKARAKGKAAATKPKAKNKAKGKAAAAKPKAKAEGGAALAEQKAAGGKAKAKAKSKGIPKRDMEGKG